jgi:hypothetical protein
LSLLKHSFTAISVGGAGLLAINLVYNLHHVDHRLRNALSILTIQNVKGGWIWPALGATYAFSKFLISSGIELIEVDFIIIFFGKSPSGCEIWTDRASLATLASNGDAPKSMV